LAKITLKSSVQWEQGVRCQAKIRDKQIVIDEPKELGGTDEGPNPVELLLAALGGCLNIIVNSFAAQYQVEIKGLTVETEGDIDPDGYTEKNPSVRPGLQEVRYSVKIDSPSPQKNVQQLLEHVDRICPIKDTLSGVPVTKL
jgi:uncharacterized OsmC-like protein